MDSPLFASRIVGSTSLRSQMATNIGPAQQASANENQTPTSIPKGFEGMLKTTTETGDIGLFSIKPSRLPQPLNTPRRTGGTYVTPSKQQALQKLSQPYGGPTMVDDRRRLPSYARDVSSDLASSYDTASQNSSRSRILKGSDHRSFSMTQSVPYSSSYTLNNQRSYTSLRSQAEIMVQRPRSPFAYPTRLRRPGFRPSSPALTDGGVVDYSRRAEIERPLFESRQFSSSPASLYARRRQPPLTSIRTDANFSIPSLSDQSSPARRSLSPLQRSITPCNDRAQKARLNFDNHSPALSSYSLASTINLYTTPRARSATTTPGRVSASPLYYDYTEEFENENKMTSREPPPAFHIERTIPEERPLSTDCQPTLGRISDAICDEVDTSDIAVGSSGAGQCRWIESAGTRSKEESYIKSSIDRPEYVSSVCQSSRSENGPSREGQPEISPFEESNRFLAETKGSSNDAVCFEALDDIDSTSHLSSFPVPEASQIHRQVKSSRSLATRGKLHVTDELVSRTDAASAPNSLPAHLDQIPLCTTGSTTACEGILRYGVAKAQESSFSMFENQMRSLASSPYIPISPLDTRSVELEVAPILHPLDFKSRDAGLNDKEVNYECKPAEKYYNFRSKDCQSSSDSRPILPMLAPEPISPARQAKLKNSVPQLMKALPPLPSDMFIHTLSPSTVSTSLAELPCSNSPSDSSLRFTPTSSQQYVDSKSQATIKQVVKAEETPLVSELDSFRVDTRLRDGSEMGSPQYQDAATPPAPKLKLKMRNSTLRSTLPLNSRPWNLEESYPWNSQQPSIRLPSLLWEPKPRSSKPPKFKLKITRASNSTQGTVRVNRSSIDLGRSGDLLTRPSKDLFTSGSGLDVIFRKVSRNLRPQRLSSSSSHSGEEQLSSVSSVPIDHCEAHTRFNVSLPLPSLMSLGPEVCPTEVRSFFSDDSSRVREVHSLKKRFSNLRARIAVPYGSRNGSQSFDDIVFRQHLHSEVPKEVQSQVGLPGPNENSKREGVFGKKVHGRRLKEKVSGWLQGARAALQKAKAKA